MNRAQGTLVCGITPDAAGLADEFHRPMRSLVAYWDERRDGGRAIAKARLDPVEIPQLLSNLFLVDLVSRTPFDIRFRLLGTAIVDIEGEITGKRLSHLIPRGVATEGLWAHYERVMSGDVCLRHESLAWQDRDFIPYDVLLLPMTRAGESIDSAVGMALYHTSSRRCPAPAT